MSLGEPSLIQVLCQSIIAHVILKIGKNMHSYNVKEYYLGVTRVWLASAAKPPQL
jgi:hypothetical protein